MIQERAVRPVSGYLALVVILALQVATIVGLVNAIIAESVAWIIVTALLVLVVFVCWFGLFMVHPNEAKVLQLFGKYVGTASEPGLRFANPFFSKEKVSLRIRNFESSQLKVNEAGGSPIEIAAVVVWKVVDLSLIHI